MKQILFVAFALSILSGCWDRNRGYGYRHHRHDYVEARPVRVEAPRVYVSP